jgi:hypothetical protein
MDINLLRLKSTQNNLEIVLINSLTGGKGFILRNAVAGENAKQRSASAKLHWYVLCNSKCHGSNPCRNQY